MNESGSSHSRPNSPADESGDGFLSFLASRMRRKSSIVIVLVLVLLLVVIISAVLLSISDAPQPGDKKIPSQKRQGSTLTPDQTTPGPPSLSQAEMLRIVESIHNILGDEHEVKRLIDESKNATSKDILKDIIAQSMRAVDLIHQQDMDTNSETRARFVRQILKVVLEDRNSTSPLTDALTSGPFMDPEVIFDRPLETGFRTWDSNMTVQEVVRSPEFQERLKTFVELTDGMGIMHVESIGKEAGEELVDEVDKEVLEKDISWLRNFQDVLVNFTQDTSQPSVPINDTPILKQEDLDTLNRLWDDEIRGRKQFGFGQLRNEMNELNGVNFAYPDATNQDEAQKLRLQQLALRLRGSRIPQARLGGAAVNDTSVLLRMSATCDPDEEMACDDGASCFFKSERCDRDIQCADNSDELDCDCKRYLDPRRLCDGFDDCPDGEDERDCKCPKNMFYCDSKNLRPVCISAELRCNNVLDCDSGADEKFCFELSPYEMEASITSQPHSKGLTHVKTTEGWKILSLEVDPGTDRDRIDAYIDDLASSICLETMTFTSMTPKVTFISDPQQFSKVAHLRLDFGAKGGLITAREGGRYDFEILPPHDDSIIFDVDCGRPVCGLKSDRLGQEVLEGPKSEDEDFQVRIVGGTASVFGNWPFIVGITRNGRFICGATVIEPYWILTAAHCLQDFRQERFHFQVLAGMYRRYSRSSMEQVRIIERIRLHEDYNSTWLNHDLALAKVDRPFDFNYAVSTVCLPEGDLCGNEDVMAPHPGAECVSAGWGKTLEAGKQSDELREVEIPVLSQCARSYNDVNYQICGGYEEGGKDSCQGDSGGPLFCRNPDRPGSWYLGGVISHGIGCARPDSPGVYTRVCKYTRWIQDTLYDESVGMRLERNFAIMEKHMANTVCPTFTCDSGKCIDEENICNLRVDCFDSRDEMYCITDEFGRRVLDPNADPEGDLMKTTMEPTDVSTEMSTAMTGTRGSIHEIHQTDLTCPPGMFRCKKIFQCVPEPARCNLQIQCMDMSDELGCKCRDYMEALAPGQICDGHPDCANWDDEIGCDYCRDDQAAHPDKKFYYCNLSKKCIRTDDVCDTVHDCDMREDERYCINVANGETIQLGLDGRPIQHTRGLLTINTKGVWRAVCAERWDKHINDRVCRYTGRRDSQRYRLIQQSERPHLSVSELDVSFPEAKSVYPRSVNQSDAAAGPVLEPLDLGLAGMEELSLFLDKTRTKRQSNTCKYVNTECSAHPTCGVMPLYNFLGQDTPAFGPGVFPWTAILYLDGQYLCGATLVHQDWVLIGEGCARKVNPPYDYVVARLGGYRDGPFQSAHEALRRIVHITKIPRTKIYLGRFARSVKLSEYINVICIPKVRWIPRNTECVITGRSDDGALNHAFETLVLGRCNAQGASKFDLCAKEVARTNECLKEWSGALACPDGTGKYYAIGVYYSQDDGCNGKPPPSVFTPLVTRSARDGISRIIKTAEDGPSPYSDLPDDFCLAEKGQQRCPLGNCIDPSNMCNGYPDCNDCSDENLEVCQSLGPVLCSHLNSTHCECPSAGDMLCRNQVCVSKALYCDGRDDCGDGTDEPENCESDCSVGLALMDPSKICDDVIDCQSLTDLGNDESASRCCDDPDKQYRCVLGYPQLKTNNTEWVDFRPNQCINSANVCDDNPVDQESCVNGADESDCQGIWPGELPPKSNLPTDPFGRFRSQAEGYLYFVSNGRSFVYCANPDVFTEERLPSIGDALCKQENYERITSITLHEPESRDRVSANVHELSEDEIEHYAKCQVVYLVCVKNRNIM